jgi:hypothetical protein
MLVVIFTFLIGALGLRSSSEECERDPEITSESKLIQCYHIAALTQAYLCAPGPRCEPAIDTCDSIWIRFGSPEDPDTGNDIRKKAELVSNTCFYDIAKITRNNETCGYITQRDDFGTQLFGDIVTRDMCYDETTRLANIAPENYYANNPNNICAIVFILPFFVLGGLILQRP